MEFNVAQLLKSTVGESRRFEVDEHIKSVDEFEAVEPVRGSVRLLRTNHGVYVDAQLKSTIRLVCGRCLEDALEPVELHIREEFFPTADVNTGAPLAPEGDAEAGLIDDHHILDLDDAFRQYALISLPIRPLCRPDCAGLCPNCGKNLNDGPCGCPVDDAPEAVEPLARLLRDFERPDSAQDNQN